MGLTEDVRRELVQVFAGRRVVCAGGLLAGMHPLVQELRAVGAAHMLLMPTGVGTGPVPEGNDIDVLVHELPLVSNATAHFRAEEALFAAPPEPLVDAVRTFSRGEVMLLAQPFSAVTRFGPFPVYGPRRPEWVALEDKTTNDALFDAAAVPHPPSAVVPVDTAVLDAACQRLDAGNGTVWSGDARDGFNGGAEYVRWVRDGASRASALQFFAAHCARVRVAPYVEGVPCSIHGFVTGNDIVVFRPVELVTLRTADERGLRYCGAATYFDPPVGTRGAMRAAARSIGARLRSDVGFRGAFTIDGICGADGWVATECNPRGGAGLAYVAACAPELLVGLSQRTIVAGGLTSLDARALESYVLDRADKQRWGGAWTSTSRRATTCTTPVVGDANGYRRARDDETADATMAAGPGPSGGFVRFEPVPERTPVGRSLAPRAAAAFGFADQEFGTDVGPVRPAVDLDASS
jgi:hypothetical protein